VLQVIELVHAGNRTPKNLGIKYLDVERTLVEYLDIKKSEIKGEGTMYGDPFALDRIRINEGLIRRRIATAPQRPTRAPRPASESANFAAETRTPRLRLALAGMLNRRSTTPVGCVD